MRRLLALAFGLFTLGVGCLLHARAQFFVPGPALWAPGAATCAQKWSSTQINSNLSGGGTTTVTQTNATNTFAPAFGAQNFTTGKYYIEFSFTGIDALGDNGYGLGNTSSATTSGNYLGISADTLGMLVSSNMTMWVNNVDQIAYTAQAISTTDRFGFAVDLTNNLIWVEDITKSSGWYGSANANNGNPATGANGFSITQTGFTITAHPVVPAISLFNSSSTGTGYFASTSWIGTAPSGFGQMCM